MKRLLVSAAALPLVYAAAAHAETKISTATTTPVRTSTAASGQPDSLTIEAAGSISPTAAGAAVTVDSSHAVTNSGTISFNNVSGATGVLVAPGVSTTITNAGSITLLEDYTGSDADGDGDVDGAFAQGSGRYAIRLTGPATVTLSNSGTITVEGNDSAGISVEGRLTGALVHSGTISLTGDRGVGVRADSVSGDAKILGTVSVQGEGSTAVQLGDVDGGVVLQGAISATGYRSASRSSDSAARGKLDADDLKQGGGAVRITGNVGRGVLLDRPPTDSDSNNSDEDADGIADSAEGTAAVTSYGAAPALDIGSATAATRLGVVGAGGLNYGLVNRGTITGDGVNDGVSAIAVRIGQAGGGAVTVQNGISNALGTISARAYGASATAVLLNAGAAVPAFVNSGTISAQQSGGRHDARGIVDLSGSLAYVENSGAITATVTADSGVTATGRGVALDLSANTAGALVRQWKINSTDTPKMTGDVRFGSGADRFELLAGTFAGNLSFGAGEDSLVLDGGATAEGAISDGDGRLAIEVRDGKLGATNTAPITVSSLTLGSKGVLAVNIDPAATSARINVSGAATLAAGSEVDVTLAGLSRGTKSFQVLQAASLTVGQAGATLAGAPWLYQASLRADQTAGALFVDVRPKTASELGLNRSGAQAYAAVFDSLDKNDAIESAFLNQTTKAGFEALYDQMLPDHSGGTMMSAQAISTAISQAVAAPMNIDRESGTGAWAQEIVFQIRRDRQDAMGFRTQGFGFAGGMDLQGEHTALGANVSFVTTDVKDRGATAGEELSVNQFGAGLYWRFDGGALQATARGGLAYGFYKGDRRLISPTLNLRAKSDYGAWSADAFGQVSYEARLGAFYARPELSLSYLRLSEGGYSEKGGGAGFDLHVDKRTGDLLTGQGLVAIGWRMGDEVYFAPELKVGYRAKIAGGPARTTAHFDGGADFTLDPEDVFKGGAVVRAGIRGGAAKALYAIDAGATVDGDYQEYDVRAVVRFQF